MVLVRTQQKKNLENWTLVQIPDTQDMSVNCPGLFDQMTQYIVDQKNTRNIKMVLSPGDIVTEDGGDPNTYTQGQYETAKGAYDILLDAKIPFLMSPASHDYDSKNGIVRTKTSWSNAFPVSYFKKTVGYGEEYNNLSANMFRKLYINDELYYFFTVEHCPRKVVVEWVENIINTEDPKYVVFATHAWLFPDGDRDNGLQSDVAGSGGSACYEYYGANGSKTDDCWSAEDVYQYLHTQFPEKMILTLGQHHTKGQPDNSMAAKRTDTVNGYPVNQVACNYQNLGCNGQAFLRFYLFKPLTREIDVTTYNPATATAKKDSVNQFTLNY